MAIHEKICFFTLIIFISLSIIFISRITGAEKGVVQWPYMAMDNDSFNAGYIHEGEIVEHSFTVINKGTIPLILKTVKPG